MYGIDIEFSGKRK